MKQSADIAISPAEGLYRLPGLAARGLIFLYQITLSPLLHLLCGPAAGCRFHPTCSRYAAECFRQFPFHRALALSLKRLFKCHPFTPGGYDPPPQ